MLGTLLALMVVGQFEDSIDKNVKIEPFPPTPQMQRRILEAVIQARQWATIKADESYPSSYRLSFRPRQQQIRVNQSYEKLKDGLREAAYRQILEAYSIDAAMLAKIMANKDLRNVRFTREYVPHGPPKGKIGMATYPWAFRMTRFNPDAVKIPEQLLKRRD